MTKHTVKYTIVSAMLMADLYQREFGHALDLKTCGDWDVTAWDATAVQLRREFACTHVELAKLWIIFRVVLEISSEALADEENPP